MTAVDLDALDKLRGAATPGPWATVTRGGQCSATSEWWAEYGVACGGKPEFTVGDDEDAHADAALIVAAVNALPDLIAEARKYRALREAVDGLAVEGEREAESEGFPVPEDAPLLSPARLRSAVAAVDAQ